MRRHIAFFALAVLIGFADFAAYGQGGGKPMTNEDVIQMLRSGVPETAVISLIGRSIPHFDLSTRGLSTLKGSDVNEGIVRAMLQAEWTATAGLPGTPPPAGGSSLTPAGRAPTIGQATPQKSPPMSTVLAKIHSSTGKLGPVVSNPAVGQSNAATIATLGQQKQVALNERGQGGAPAGAVPSTNTTSRLSTMQGPRIAAAAPPPQTSSSNRAAMAGQTSIALSCATFNTSMISTVSGQQGSVTFTQDPQFNPFTIKGCNFGSARGQAQINSSNGRKLASLNVDTWTDTLITVEVDPTLTDVLDQDNVTLVIFPASGPQTQKAGLHFYAKRAELLLGSLPTSEASLTPINDDSGSPVTAKFSSPYPVSSASMSGGVDRYNVVRFVGGTDSFDFSKLRPGFVLEKFQVDTLSQSVAGASSACGGFGPTTSTAYTDGNWAWQMSGNTIQVTWMEAHCHDAFNGDYSDASYGLNVWVVGPVISSATSPWQDGVR
jgi:hypothetical protein